MISKTSLLRDVRFWFYAALTSVICFKFWTGSRYPSLEAKAEADPATALQTPLGFSKHFYWAADTLVGRIGLTTMEWIETNRVGMTFGLMFAAAVISLLPYIPKGNPNGRWALLRGVVLGTPLGVCANCAAPIGASMLRGGSRLETALAVNFSSPSFNIIVVGMLFTLFPWYLATLKIVSALVLIFIAIPIVVRLVPPPASPQKLDEASTPTGLMGRISDFLTIKVAEAPPATSNIFVGLASGALTYGINFVRVFILVVPLMLLAGFLGAVMIELLPWQNFGLELVGKSAMVALSFLILAAFLGTMLPVPIAFDMLICAMLLRSGAPDYIVGAMLITLGIFSVYPMMLYARLWSLRGAALLGAAVMIVGIVGGYAAQQLGKVHGDRQETLLLRSIAQGIDRDAAIIVDGAPRLGAAEIAGQIAALPPCVTNSFSKGKIESCSNLTDGVISGDLRYARHDGTGYGLAPVLRSDPDLISVVNGSCNGGMAQGDVNQDGWPDIAVGTAQGPQLFINVGGRWLAQDLGLPLDGKTLDGFAGPVALMDLDNDGLPELIYGTVDQGVHIMWNNAGAYSQDNVTTLLADKRNYVMALGFADFDRDGQLDIVAGMAAGVQEPTSAYPNQNYLIYNPAGSQNIVELPGYGGETLSLLAHDFDHDGWVDLIFGNDFTWPDVEYKNVNGKLVQREGVADGMRPETTLTTMTLDVATLGDDATDVLYSGQIAKGPFNQKLIDWPVLDDLTGCAAYDDPQSKAMCDRYRLMIYGTFYSGNAKNYVYCDSVSRKDHPYCVVASSMVVRNMLYKRETCSDIGVLGLPTWDRYCDAVKTTTGLHMQGFPDFSGYGKQAYVTENLLQRFVDGKWQTIDEAAGAKIGAWTWNAKFVDADADGYQDLVIANGWWGDQKQSDMLLYRGDGKSFTLHRQAGLDFDMPTNAHVSVDFDRDGDLDLIAQPIHMRPLVFENTQTAGRFVEIELDSACGNRSGVGAKLVATSEGRKMTRWIKASGGYQSSMAPAALFGLGEAAAIDRLDIILPGQDGIMIDLPLGPGRHLIHIDSAACGNAGS
ncbi:MAG: FG-GAP-like repeat-containing protein [Alphaproteobacteria bacterium]